MHQEHWFKALNYIFRNFLCGKKKKIIDFFFFFKFVIFLIKVVLKLS